MIIIITQLSYPPHFKVKWYMYGLKIFLKSDTDIIWYEI